MAPPHPTSPPHRMRAEPSHVGWACKHRPKAQRQAEACSYTSRAQTDTSNQRQTQNCFQHQTRLGICTPQSAYLPRVPPESLNEWARRSPFDVPLSLWFSLQVKCLPNRSPGAHKPRFILLPWQDLQAHNPAETLTPGISLSSTPGPGPRPFGPRRFCICRCCRKLSEGDWALRERYRRP